MNKKLLTTLCCLGLSIALYGQNGWLPPDHFISNTNLCDNTPWKLVFWDNFDGTQSTQPNGSNMSPEVECQAEITNTGMGQDQMGI